MSCYSGYFSPQFVQTSTRHTKKRPTAPKNPKKVKNGLKVPQKSKKKYKSCLQHKTYNKLFFIVQGCRNFQQKNKKHQRFFMIFKASSTSGTEPKLTKHALHFTFKFKPSLVLLAEYLLPCEELVSAKKEPLWHYSEHSKNSLQSKTQSE